jgi:hypothetical protein
VRTTHDPVTDRFITRAQTPEWADNPLHPEDAAEIRRRVAALRPEFERLGHEDWHDFMLARLDPIEKHAAATERTIWTATT